MSFPTVCVGVSVYLYLLHTVHQNGSVLWQSRDTFPKWGHGFKVEVRIRKLGSGFSCNGQWAPVWVMYRVEESPVLWFCCLVVGATFRGGPISESAQPLAHLQLGLP